MLSLVFYVFRPRACNFMVALLEMEERCWSKLSSESIKIPSKVSFVLVLTEDYTGTSEKVC